MIVLSIIQLFLIDCRNLAIKFMSEETPNNKKDETRNKQRNDIYSNNPKMKEILRKYSKIYISDKLKNPGRSKNKDSIANECLREISENGFRTTIDSVKNYLSNRNKSNDKEGNMIREELNLKNQNGLQSNNPVPLQTPVNSNQQHIRLNQPNTHKQHPSIYPTENASQQILQQNNQNQMHQNNQNFVLNKHSTQPQIPDQSYQNSSDAIQQQQIPSSLISQSVSLKTAITSSESSTSFEEFSYILLPDNQKPDANSQTYNFNYISSSGNSTLSEDSRGNSITSDFDVNDPFQSDLNEQQTTQYSRDNFRLSNEINEEKQPENEIKENSNQKEKQTNQKTRNENENQETYSESEDILNTNINEGKPKAKQVGKKYYFPPNVNYSSSSSSSSSSSANSPSESRNIKSSADLFLKSKNKLIENLPQIKSIKIDNENENDINPLTLENYNANYYENLRCCYQCIHESFDVCKKADIDYDSEIVFNNDLLDFQKNTEKRFLMLINEMRKILNNDQIISHDKYCPKIDMKLKKSPVSYSTAIDARGRLPSRDSTSDAKSTIENSEMKDEPNNDYDDVDEKSVIINDDSDGDEKSVIINDNSDGDDDDGKSVIVNSYISKINILNLNEKLSSFYQGIYDKQTHYSYEITNVESSAIISYRSNSSNTEDCLICELAYTTFDEKMKAHVLNLKEIKIETGFYLPVTTMYFHHDDKNDQNKLYLCGDVRVKEFTIEGLDKINNENYQDEIVIWNSNTFYFGKHDFASTVITVWENELVLGYGNDLYFWNIENERKVRNKKEKLKIEQKDYKKYGIDFDKVDLTKGKHNKSTSIILPNKTCQISSFSVLKSSSSNKTFLAVSFLQYPIIYIYDKNHINISRLISHTMDITCLKSLNYNLFSGSLDMIARMWNVNKGAPEILYDTRNQQITAIEPGIFDEKVVLFTGGKDNTVQCFGITDKKQLFEFVLNHNLVPKLIGFVAGNDEKKGNHAKLMIVSKNIKYKAYMKILHKYQIHFFEF